MTYDDDLIHGLYRNVYRILCIDTILESCFDFR